MPLTVVGANALLNASVQQAAYPYTTGPMKLALITARAGTPATTAGTEATGGSGPYARQTATFGTASSSGSISNTTVISFPGMPACTIVAFELWDSAATPNRIWQDLLTTQRPLQAGDSVTWAIGSLVLNIGT